MPAAFQQKVPAQSTPQTRTTATTPPTTATLMAIAAPRRSQGADIFQRDVHVFGCPRSCRGQTGDRRTVSRGVPGELRAADAGDGPGADESGMVEATFSGYKDYDNSDVVYPTRVVHKRDGRTVLDLTLSNGWYNLHVILPLPRVSA